MAGAEGTVDLKEVCSPCAKNSKPSCQCHNCSPVAGVKVRAVRGWNALCSPLYKRYDQRVHTANIFLQNRLR
jgi:hypothetical protein